MEGLCKEYNDDFKKLSKKKKKDQTLWKTAERGHVHCLKAILQAGANVNSADEHDYTPLKFAAMRGRYACIEALLEEGADVNHHRKGYDTALETVASYTSGKKCFDLLIKSGADVNIVNDAGYPLITWVAGCARPGYLDSLIRAGADVNAGGGKGKTTLLFASFHQVIHNNVENDLECVKLLLRAGGNVYICERFGHNSLTWHIVMSKDRSGRLPPVKDVCMVLFAAGEQLIGTVDSKHLTDALDQKMPIPDYLLNEDLKLCLKHMCREAMRKHLLQMSNLNLFCRIPGFTFPPHLREYLMYYMSIDDAVEPVYDEKTGEIVAKR